MSPHAPLISKETGMLIYSVATHPVSNMLNKLHGQPESYDKKYGIYLQVLVHILTK
jgi:hypothetical protein